MDPNIRLKTFRIPKDRDGNFLDIEIHQPVLRSENLNLTTWGSSFILASQLHLINIDTQSLHKQDLLILELGAGTGLVGISAAAIWKANVILTDLDTITPGLAQNIEANEQTLKSNDASAGCGSLDWAHPTDLSIRPKGQDGAPVKLSSRTDKASIILAADTIYSEEHPQMLADTILAWLKPGPESRVIIAYPLRPAYLDHIRELWERLEVAGLRAFDEGKAEAGDEWDDERSIEWSVWQWRHE